MAFLVSLSAMVVKDIVVPLTHDQSRGLSLSRWVLVAVGVVGGALAWHPPALIGFVRTKRRLRFGGGVFCAFVIWCGVARRVAGVVDVFGGDIGSKRAFTAKPSPGSG